MALSGYRSAIGQFGAKICAPIRRSPHVVAITAMRRRKIEKELVWSSVRPHVYTRDSSENWKFFFHLRHSGTKNAGFRKTVFRVEFFLANAGLLETLVSVRNRTAGRRGRQNVCVWQTWQGYYLRVLSWSSLNILCSLVFCKKISLKESEVWWKVISKQNYCRNNAAAFRNDVATMF